MTVAQDGLEVEYTARIVVGADGKTSAVRSWTGGESHSDPEHHRFGGVLVSGVRTDDRDTDNLGGGTPLIGVNWFAAGGGGDPPVPGRHGERLREWEADRSFPALLAVAAKYMPDGALDAVQQVGPIGFFPNCDSWGSKVAGNDVVLIGDAAGAPDPSQGHGTALIFHDVRALSEALLSDQDWIAATAAYGDRRDRYFAAVRAYDRWNNVLDGEEVRSRPIA